MLNGISLHILKNGNLFHGKKIEQSIYKLQGDIACAEIEENYKKARNLQRILLSKDSALLYSIKRVTMFNRGYKTLGVDGMIIKSHPERMALFYNLKSKNFEIDLSDISR